MTVTRKIRRHRGLFVVWVDGSPFTMDYEFGEKLFKDKRSLKLDFDGPRPFLVWYVTDKMKYRTKKNELRICHT
jgi:hypothetical protein